MSPPIIAVDFDDVLCQTNRAVAEWHNNMYGTAMKLSDFHYYHYWKNPLWGTPDETLHKVKQFYATDLMKPIPIPGALEGAQALRKMGYKLAIVTARHTNEVERSQAWLDQYFPGVFESLTCTGQFQHSTDGKEVHVKISKAQVCHRLGASVLIDDSVENALVCAAADPPIRILLFGDYEWNKRESRVETAKDEMSFNARLLHEHGREWWKDESVDPVLPRNVTRVKDWHDVVRWVGTQAEISAEA